MFCLTPQFQIRKFKLRSWSGRLCGIFSNLKFRLSSLVLFFQVNLSVNSFDYFSCDNNLLICSGPLDQNLPVSSLLLAES